MKIIRIKPGVLKRITAYICIMAAAGGMASGGVQTERVYLSGKGPSDAVEWDFHCSSGRKSGEWTTIPVPSNWEQHGFGGYDYGHVAADEKHDEVGTYRTTFLVPEEWKDRHVRLAFEGSMTETSIKVNGMPVGAPNFGGYLPFRYQLDGNTFRAGQVDPVLKYGELNELEVRVAKKPSNRSVDLAERQADFWVFGGIYRPVYLEVLPKEFIHRVAIDADADGQFSMDVFPQERDDVRTRRVDGKVVMVDTIEAQILTLEDDPVGEPFSVAVPGPVGRAKLSTKIDNPALWTPEMPNLYQVRTRLMKAGEVLHERTDTFGFRTLELRAGDGLYLNGGKLLIKGVNRNGMHADTARAIDPEDAWDDARLIKEMNANLVRFHMPPTTAFMEACDRLGLLTIIELTVWQKPAIDTPIARNLAYELVTKYQNHPACILWVNGNEGGFNKEIDEIYHLLDPQERPVIHPWGVFDGIDTLHYPEYGELERALGRPNVVLPTEFLHGLYDGGHGAGLADYWELMVNSPVSAGGVLWCWADAGVARTDQDGKIDTDGNHSADGIVGPRREKEASYYTIREIWSPLRIPLEELPDDFDGTLPLKNSYLYSNLDGCRLDWELARVPAPGSAAAKAEVSAQGGVQLAGIGTGETGAVKLPLPENWKSNDLLTVSAIGADGVEIMHWSWPLRSDMPPAAGSEVVVQSKGKGVYEIGDIRWSFDPDTGQLAGCVVNGRDTGLGAGPVLYAGTGEGALPQAGSWQADTSQKGDTVVIESINEEDGSSFSWTLSPDGSAALEYSFAPPQESVTYCAAGFDLPGDTVASKRWLGDGPHRIWANRRQGPQFGLYENDYTDTVPGESWDYPAFKGIFGNVDWMSLELSSGIRLLLQPEGFAEVGVLHPSNAKDVITQSRPKLGPQKATWDYPEAGGLFLFHKLPAVGTKFKKADVLGPQSRPETLPGPIEGRVVFSPGGEISHNILSLTAAQHEDAE